MRKKIKKMNTGGMSPGFNADPLYSFAQGQMSGGSGMGQLMPELQQQNEFDQAASILNQAERAKKGYMSGKQLLETARGVKKGKDLAAASKTSAELVSGLGKGASTAPVAATAATEVAKQGIQHGGFANFLTTGAGAAATAGLGIGGKIIQELDKKDGNYSKAGAMGGGAMQGAAMGAALGPLGMIAGGAIGAGVGLMQKNKFEAEARAEELTQKAEASKANARAKLAGNALLKTFPVEGIKEQVYAHGGEHDPVPGKRMMVVNNAASKPFQMRLESQEEANMTLDQRKKRSDHYGNDFKHLYDAFSESEIAEYDKYFNEYYPNIHLDIFGFTDKHNQFKRDPLPQLMQSKGLPESSRPELVTNLAQNQVPRVVGQDEYYIDPMRARSAAGFRGGHQDGKYAIGARRTFENPDGTRFTNTEPYDTEHRDINRINALDRNRFRTSESFKSGGHTNNPDYTAEGGEMIQHAPGDLPATDNNGTVKPITDTIARIEGDKHIAQSGGVGMSGDKPARIYSDQLHVPADVLKQLMKL